MSKRHCIYQSVMLLITCCPSLSEIGDFLSKVDQMNRRWKEVEDSEPPVSDSVQLTSFPLHLLQHGKANVPQVELII